VPGHWEGDLIKGARNGLAIGTLVERTIRLVILARMTGTDAQRAREGFTKKLRHVPTLLQKTLTYDRGTKMAEHERLAQRLAIRIFFADPYSPWQRGTNENTNGLLRQYRAQGRGPVGLHPARVECHCPSAEHPPTNMFEHRHATESLCAIAPSFTRCTWDLKLSPLSPKVEMSGLCSHHCRLCVALRPQASAPRMLRPRRDWLPSAEDRFHRCSLHELRRDRVNAERLSLVRDPHRSVHVLSTSTWGTRTVMNLIESP
jgi:hypothetical protein